jgi:hypothetical protein
MEFALVSIPLILTMVAIFEFGLLYFDLTKLDSTTREVSRRIAVCANGCDYSEKYKLVSSPTGSPVPYDIFALAIVGVQDYDNPARLEPKNVEYIHLQRVNLDGTTNVLTNTNYVNSAGQQKNVYTELGTDGNQLGLRPFYMRYKYSASATAEAPFVLDTAYVPPGISAPQRAYSNRGWPSKGYNIGGNGYYVNGRNVCEPTDRYYVEIAYRHYWITPLVPVAQQGGYITMYRKISGKVEPRFFGGVPVQQGICV